MRFLPVAYSAKGDRDYHKHKEEKKKEKEEKKLGKQKHLEETKNEEDSKEAQKKTDDEGCDLVIEAMQWGLYRPGSNDLVINGRFEELVEKPMFRGLLEKKRAVVRVFSA